MQGTDLKEMELGYLYYSLYAYRRKVESDIKKIIQADTASGQPIRQRPASTSPALYEHTRKLRNISLIISKLISLNKVYK
ncbi:MAG: hypothetical protein COW65_00775 [Cytophagales bacterium CG18_big_fil_WC_8_21_14_2_50_42_9]|nr:MAG: hypothetical protein COW65_00775 [Cytophagales bacterium CG18_big_fil_WC_8_21_14_2_50_42_9]